MFAAPYRRAYAIFAFIFAASFTLAVRADPPCAFGITDIEPLCASAFVWHVGYYDDGRGTALFAIGDFHEIGGVKAEHIARWNGAAWEPLGDGLGAGTNAMATFDDGRGPALYVAGSFTKAGGKAVSCIARWDGANWERLPDDFKEGALGITCIYTIKVFDDGSGAKLFVGGAFSTIGDVQSPALVSWDGSAWGDSHGKFAIRPRGDFGPTIGAMFVNEKSDPRRLVVGGVFGKVDDVTANCVAAWDGQNWTALGEGVIESGNWVPGVFDLGYADFGAGDRLYAAGAFQTDSRLYHIAQWDGDQWTPFAVSDGFIKSIRVFDADGGPSIWVCGEMSVIHAWGTDKNIAARGAARWDGAQWTAAFPNNPYPSRNYLTVDPNTDPPSMLVYGGMKQLDGVTISRFARYGCLNSGDTDCDASLNFDDIDGFVQALADPDKYKLDHPSCDIRHADINADGAIDFADVDPFVDCLIDGCG